MAEVQSRVCVSCAALKPSNEENYRLVTEMRSGKPYVYQKHKCRPCEYGERVEYGRKNKEKQNAQRRAVMTPSVHRHNNLRSKYGLSTSDYNSMLEKQGGKCAICKKSENEFHKSGRYIPMTVDHDHATGKIRGLLCGSCNRGLGDFRDNPSFLIEAVAYLEAHLGR